MASTDDSLGKNVASEIFRSIKPGVKNMPINSSFKRNIVDELINEKFFQRALFSRLIELGRRESKPTPELIKTIMKVITPMTCAALGISYTEQLRTSGTPLQAIGASDDRKNPLSIQNKIQYFILLTFLNNEAMMKLFLQFKMDEALRAAILRDFEEAKKSNFKIHPLLIQDLVDFNEVPMFLLMDFDKHSMKFFQTAADLFQFLDEDEEKAKSHYEGLEEWGYSREEAEAFKRRMHAKIEETYQLKRDIAKQLESDYTNILRRLDGATGEEREDLLERKKALEGAMQKHKEFCEHTSADNLDSYAKKHFTKPEHQDLHHFYRIRKLERNNQVLSADDHAVKRRIAADPRVRQFIQDHDSLVREKVKTDLHNSRLAIDEKILRNAFTPKEASQVSKTPLDFTQEAINPKNSPIIKTNASLANQAVSSMQPAKASQMNEPTSPAATPPTTQQDDTTHHTIAAKKQLDELKKPDISNLSAVQKALKNIQESNMANPMLVNEIKELAIVCDLVEKANSNSDIESFVNKLNGIAPSQWDGLEEEYSDLITAVETVPALQGRVKDIFSEEVNQTKNTR